MHSFRSASGNSTTASSPWGGAPPGAYALTGPEAMIEQERALIARIKLTAGVEERAYERYYVPLLRDYAAFIDSLPASRAQHHFAPGGLWRHSLEVALFALQGADNKIFTASEPVERRHLVEPRWRLAAFVAGLLAEVGITMSRMRVTTRKGEVWEPVLGPLLGWATGHGERYYYVQWLPQHEHTDDACHRIFSGVLATRLVPTGTLAYLAEVSTAIVHELMLCLSGQVRLPGRETLLHTVEQARKASIEREIRSRAGIVPTGTVGYPVELYLLDAIRHLIKSCWRLNEDGSPLWGSRQDGLFLVWEQAAPQIVQQLERTGVHAMPRDSKTLAELLRLHQIVRAPQGAEQHGLFFRIHVPRRGETAALSLSNPEAVFEEMPTLPEIQLLNPADRPPPASEATPRATAKPSAPETQRKAATATMQTPPEEASAVQEQLPLAYPKTPGALATQTVHPQAQPQHRSDEREQPPRQPGQDVTGGGRATAAGQPASLGAAAALAHLRSHGKAGEVLAALAEEVQRGRRQVGADLFVVEEGMAVSFPGAVQGLGFEALKVIQTLNTHGWVFHGQGEHKGVVREVDVGRTVPVRAFILVPSVAKYVALAAGLSTPPGWGDLADTQPDA